MLHLRLGVGAMRLARQQAQAMWLLYLTAFVLLAMCGCGALPMRQVLAMGFQREIWRCYHPAPYEPPADPYHSAECAKKVLAQCAREFLPGCRP
jgi:hypothetical protein